MNVENIKKLALLIKEQPHVTYDASSGFSMLAIHHPCGTPSCIAGWANYLACQNGDISENDGIAKNTSTLINATAYLGIRKREADKLFFPLDAAVDYLDLTPDEAHDVLMHLAETGDVDFSVAGYKRLADRVYTKK